jgi:uncharacterized protein YwlG (UPF0340 family)
MVRASRSAGQTAQGQRTVVGVGAQEIKEERVGRVRSPHVGELVTAWAMGMQGHERSTPAAELRWRAVWLGLAEKGRAPGA